MSKIDVFTHNFLEPFISIVDLPSWLHPFTTLNHCFIQVRGVLLMINQHVSQIQCAKSIASMVAFESPCLGAGYIRRPGVSRAGLREVRMGCADRVN